MAWLTDNLPQDCCRARGLVPDPAQPTPESDAEVQWIVGSDVLHMDPSDRSSDQQRIAEEMQARRDRVSFP
jgi:hypothetical protein